MRVDPMATPAQSTFHALPEVLTALHEAETAVADFFGSLTPDEIGLRVGEAWTPAEHLAHLNTSVSAVARGFATSPLLLRIRFGRSRRPSRDFETLRAHYLGRLAEGSGARGPFVPERRDLTPDDAPARRDELLARWHRVNGRLSDAASRWTESRLDRIRLPHPLLGRLTAREMLFFTILHNHHHIAAAKRRLPRFAST